MKKTYTLLIALVFCVMLVFAFTSCGSSNECAHELTQVIKENVIEATCQSAGSYEEVVRCGECNAEFLRTPKTTDPANHIGSAWITDTEPTCLAVGEMHRECTVCLQIIETKSIEKVKEHIPGEAVFENVIPSTCSSDGSHDEAIYCTVCNSELERNSIVDGKLSHIVVTDEAKAATCTEPGLTEGEHCSVCKEVLTVQKTVAALGHTKIKDEAKAATCTEPGLTEGEHCSVCKEVLTEQKTVAALGHTKIKDEAKAATCTEPGLTEGEHCSVCMEVFVGQKTVDPLGHTEIKDESKNPTCTDSGLTEGTSCSVCDSVIKKQEIIPPLGHTEVKLDAKDATCADSGLTEGSRCSVCNEVLVEQKVISALGHTEVSDASKAATCTENGLTEGVHCSVCDEILVAQEVILATGHKNDIILSGIEPTCTNAGLSDGKQCSLCREITEPQTVLLPKRHTESVCEYVAATCTSSGLTEGKICSDCGKVLVEQMIIPAAGHSETVIPATPETDEDDGLTEGLCCAVCGEILKEQQTIPSRLGRTDIKSESLTLDGGKLIGVLLYANAEFNFNNDIKVKTGSEWKLYSDSEMTCVVESGTVHLEVGKNIYYITVSCGEESKNYIVEIIRSEYKKTYTVTFDTDGAGEIENVTVEEGGYVTKPEKPYKGKGYLFKCWCIAGTNVAWNFGKDTVTQDITLVAIWLLTLPPDIL